MKSFNITGHVLVLGGSSALGAAAAEMFAIRGARAITLSYSSNEMKANLLATRLAREYEIRTHSMKVQFPFSDLDIPFFEEQLTTAVEATGVEIEAMLVANGKSPNQPFFEQMIGGEGGWLDLMQVNLISPTMAVRSVAERMVKQRVQGSIVVIASSNGVDSFAPFSAHYDGSKGGLAAALRGPAKLYAARGVRINVLNLGWADTGMNDSVPNLDEELKRVYLGRQATAEEVAHAICFLAENTFAAKTELKLDGGYS